MTEPASTGENVNQGSIGGGLLSSLALSKNLNQFFEGCGSEVSYAELRLQPMSLQDDTSRFSLDIESERKNIDWCRHEKNVALAEHFKVFCDSLREEEVDKTDEGKHKPKESTFTE